MTSQEGVLGMPAAQNCFLLRFFLEGSTQDAYSMLSKCFCSDCIAICYVDRVSDLEVNMFCRSFPCCKSRACLPFRLFPCDEIGALAFFNLDFALRLNFNNTIPTSKIARHASQRCHQSVTGQEECKQRPAILADVATLGSSDQARTCLPPAKDEHPRGQHQDSGT